MKTTLFPSRLGAALACMACLLPCLLSSCQNLPPAEQMSDSQREAYVEHRKWDYEAEYRKQVDAENRR